MVPAEAYGGARREDQRRRWKAAWNKGFSPGADAGTQTPPAGDLPPNYADIVKSAVDAAIAVDKAWPPARPHRMRWKCSRPALPEMIGGSADLDRIEPHQSQTIDHRHRRRQRQSRELRRA